jgi:transcriptional regulator with XRE-family HTH domain
MKISTPLKAALISEGMKQRELAAEVGVHESVVSGLCRGWRNPDEPLAEKISEVLSRPREEIFPNMRRQG